MAEAEFRQLAGPWTRYFARVLDVTVIIMALSFCLGYLTSEYAPHIYYSPVIQNQYLLFFLLLPFALLLNAVIVTVAGNSLGKALFGIKAVPLEVGRSTLTFKENILRELGVWCKGLALGIPLLSVVTMVIAFGKVRKKLPTSYDAGQFTVLSFSDNRLRWVGAFLAVLLVYGAALALGVYDSIQTEQISRPYNWTNPVSGATTTIPAYWKYELVETERGSVLYGFERPHSPIVAFLGVEEGDGIDLNDYAAALRQTLERTIDLGDWQYSEFQGAWKAVGKGKDGDKQNVTVHITQDGSKFWRIVYVDPTGQSSGEIGDPDMTKALFLSIR